MKKILFADLDGTLFQSHHEETPKAGWQPLAFLRDGEAISYANPQQLAFLELFHREATVVPVTARNHDAFQRVRIPFPAEAVIDYGGVILHADGTPDEEWLERSRLAANAVEADLLQWSEWLQAESSRQGWDLNVRLIRDFGMPLYVVAKSVSRDVAVIRKVGDACRRALLQLGRSDMVLHVNGNNLALLPPWLNKRHAVEHLQQRYLATHEQLLTFGMGDSLVDLAFMGACDYLITPASSQIAERQLGVAQ